MSISKETESVLRKALETAVQSFSSEQDFEVITDIHMHLNADSGELTIYDDEDMNLTSCTVDEWIDADATDISTSVVHSLSAILQQMSDEHCFENVAISKPFSFVLEDDDRETIDELFIVDDDTVYISEDFLKGVDKELDEFLADLLKE